MTVYIEKPAVNLREELASLRNQGGYEEQQFWMDNILSNGTFDTTSDWDVDSYWVISGGVASHASSSSYYLLSQSVSLTAGQTYYVTLDIVSIASGGLRVTGISDLTFTTAGRKTFSFTATGSETSIGFARNFGTTLDCSIDNVFITTSFYSPSNGFRMPKGWVPKDVYEDGLLQREGAANDYELVYDGFDYYVKPAVAPGATTETCVIGVRK